MKRGLISWVLILALVASTFVGAMGVSLRSAKADLINFTDPAYMNNIKSAIADLGVFTSVQLDGFFNYVSPFVQDIEENEQYIVCVMHDVGTNHWAIQLFTCASIIYSYQVSSGGVTYRGLSSASNGTGTTKFRCRASLVTDGSGGRSFIAYNTVISVSDYLARNGSVNFSTVPGYQYVDWYAYPTPADMSISGRKIWISKNINEGNGGYSCNRNLFYGDEPTPTFQLRDFWIGSRRYLTTYNQQDIALIVDNDKEPWLVVGFEDSSYLYFDYDDLIDIPFSRAFVDVINPYNDKIYMFDITDISQTTIVYADIYELNSVDGFTLYATCDNVPFYLSDIQEHNVDDYNEQYSNLVELINNYFYKTESFNTNYVLPQTNLPGYLLNGLGDDPSLSYGFCVYSTGTPVGLVHSYEADFTYTWMPNTFLIVDSDLFVPIGADEILLYFNPTLLNEVDCIIVLTHDDWLSLVQYDVGGGTGTLIDPDFLNNVFYYYESNSNGTISIDGRFCVSTLATEEYINETNVYGLTFFTQHYLMHVQNMILADGIKGIANWLDSYGENTGRFQSSLLDGIGATASAVTTLNGTLALWFSDPMSWFNQISLKLDDISAKLQQIADNTDPGTAEPWYLPLWNFIQRFTPTVEQFADTITVIDTAYDDLPLLPEVTVPPAVPTVPLIGGG